jgi:hypothetical protein
VRAGAHSCALKHRAWADDLHEIRARPHARRRSAATMASPLKEAERMGSPGEMSETADNKRRRQQAKQTEGTDQRVEAVIRRCKVCEWEGELIESVGANPDCPWCHGPTDLEATLATSTGLGRDQQRSDSERWPPPEPSTDKNPHAAALGRLGGLKGGRARAKALTPNQRRRIASRAARARWEKEKDKK